MKQVRNIYVNEEWLSFSNKVKRRDGYRCLQCDRSQDQVTLQVHHEIYVAGKAPWEYALSDCLTLCKGCHAREHGLIQPQSGWSLLSITDLGDLEGICERTGCGTEIRFEHLTYHPKWGYLVVGSTCIEHLTQEDRLLSNNVIKLYKNISQAFLSGLPAPSPIHFQASGHSRSQFQVSFSTSSCKGRWSAWLVRRCGS